MAAVGGRAEDAAGPGAADADRGFPQNGARRVGIQRIDNARFRPGDDDVAAIQQMMQHRRGLEIEIGAQRVGAIADRLAGAGRLPIVIGADLAHPFARAGLEVEGDDRIGRVGRQTGIGIAGRGVDEPALGIDRRHRPDRPAGRAG